MPNPGITLEKGEESFIDCFTQTGFSRHLVAQIKNKELLNHWRGKLIAEHQIYNRKFFLADCRINLNELVYEQIKAKNLIFCEGPSDRSNSLFPKTSFTKNMGNVLMVSIPALPQGFIYQLNYRLIPQGAGLFWLGSNYQWSFQEMKPDEHWRQQVCLYLEKQLSVPFLIKDHLVVERPTTAGQKVLMLQNEVYPNVFFFNGLGTKGYLQGPYFANLFVDKILLNKKDPIFNKVFFI